MLLYCIIMLRTLFNIPDMSLWYIFLHTKYIRTPMWEWIVCWKVRKEKVFLFLIGRTRDVCILSSTSFLNKHSGWRVRPVFYVSYLSLALLHPWTRRRFFASRARDSVVYRVSDTRGARRKRREGEKRRTALAFNDPVSPIPFGHFVYGSVLEPRQPSLRISLSLSLLFFLGSNEAGSPSERYKSRAATERS